jgi:hypothetical protein
MEMNQEHETNPRMTSEAGASGRGEPLMEEGPSRATSQWEAYSLSMLSVFFDNC